ncbi:MAG: rhodanese-like domain-containing protein [Candidatus Promineifilaceae bacterium]|nr:rhodanese-like domain-containing protein [Candidatus Promineifilaceae bacterium]
MFRFLLGDDRRDQRRPDTDKVKHPAVKQISPLELQRWLTKNERLTLIDVRTPREYEVEHIQGARLLPLSVLRQRSGELPHDRPIVCVCRSGARSQAACEQLARAGHTQLFNLSGGMIAWKRDGLPYSG